MAVIGGDNGMGAVRVDAADGRTSHRLRGLPDMSQDAFSSMGSIGNRQRLRRDLLNRGTPPIWPTFGMLPATPTAIETAFSSMGGSWPAFCADRTVRLWDASTASFGFD